MSRSDLIAFLATLGADVGALDDATPLFSTSLLDSFKMVDLLSFIEGKAGFQMDPDDVSLDNLDSVEKILRFVKSKSA